MITMRVFPVCCHRHNELMNTEATLSLTVALLTDRLTVLALDTVIVSHSRPL